MKPLHPIFTVLVAPLTSMKNDWKRIFAFEK